MTLPATGRSVLSVLHANGGESPLEVLSDRLGTDRTAILQLIKSLSAARLVSSGTAADSPEQVSLTEAGRRWCASEFKQAAPAVASSPAAPAANRRLPDMAMHSMGSPTPHHKPHNADKMHGVEVVRVKRRHSGAGQSSLLADALAEEARRTAQEEPALAEEPAGFAGAPAPAAGIARPIPAPVPAATPLPDAIAVARQGPRSRPPVGHRSSGDRYTLDEEGYVTHINGIPIY